MSITSINSNTKSEAYDSYARKNATRKDAIVSEQPAEVGATYEKSTASTKKGAYSITKMSEEDRAALVQQLKDEQSARESQFMEMVQKMIGQQAHTSNLASLFSPENLAKASPEDIAKAQKDISEDGYYGIKQTSQRMFDFACALAGDDMDKLKEMERAMDKGFAQATAAWGQKLPDICQQTMDAAHQLFADYYAAHEA